jgi:hypothetical protein
MDDKTSVLANKLLSLNISVWKLDKGTTRKKLNVPVSELITTKNLNSACDKSGISLAGLRLRIKKYGSAWPISGKMTSRRYADERPL